MASRVVAPSGFGLTDLLFIYHPSLDSTDMHFDDFEAFFGEAGPARCCKRINSCMTPWMISPNSVLRSCQQLSASRSTAWELGLKTPDD